MSSLRHQPRRVVIAFGGNAISRSDQAGTFHEQRDNVSDMARYLVDVVERGVQVVVTHGNGPQVGRIALQQQFGVEHGLPAMPFDAAGAMSQGLLGYLLQQALGNELNRRGIPRLCVSVVTQVVVDKEDPAFGHPTKPVGGFYSEDEALQLETSHGWTMVEDAGRGYRRVVPSPAPTGIVEWPAIQSLVGAGAMVIAAGGGGIPVTRTAENGTATLEGVEAVIDKDRASAALGALIEADTLVLLTDIDRVAVGYGTETQYWLDTVLPSTMQAHLDAGEFPAGSMGPKVESALTFLRGGGKRAIITSSRCLVTALLENAGTQVIADGGHGSDFQWEKSANG